MICQGLLTDLNGIPVNKTLKMFFTINNIHHNKLWERDRYVSLNDGFFYVSLGKKNQISSEKLNNESTIQVGILCKDDQIHSIINNRLVVKDNSSTETLIPSNKSYPTKLQSNINLTGLNNLSSGNTIHVPGDYNNIQDAVDAAQDGDTVLVKDGTYTLKGDAIIEFQSKAIAVKSENGPNKCII
ncbi:hypothetical protein MHK_006844 [Candidatus Magnetomorum sp. HK-1]|nr:hypothetical protein MHK_006844 [Candidatus Magnetomorum sp. HK-1]